MSRELGSMKDASIYIRISTNIIILNSSKAKATLGATAHATDYDCLGLRIRLTNIFMYSLTSLARYVEQVNPNEGHEDAICVMSSYACCI